MGRIIFYEERNFQGRNYECSSDCSDIHTHLSRCNSCRVDSGCFMVYDRPSFMGNQVFLRRGEYPDIQRLGSMMGMMGMSGMTMMDSIRSCRMIPMHRGQFRMKIYERENFAGKMHELMEDCESLQERLYMSDCQSCSVMDGHWLIFEQPNFRGRMMYVRPGEYRSLREMGMSNMMRISSIRRIMDMC
ncbi:gamma-crystallin M3-like isoform X2 [Stegastes partitus]|uniref:Gamma-crystallin M3-like n=1 Tax=Stegastes partitus TaxID=144197 RepID=A0A3B5AST8_9TELE|nr:PREDICTED: gamma-crystallin M3-like isoform X2 [Stegastes partitus]